MTKRAYLFLLLALVVSPIFQNCSNPTDKVYDVESASADAEDAISILSTSSNSQIALGETLYLNVYALSSTGATLSYQWHRDGSEIAGATNSILVLDEAAESDEGYYQVSISDGLNEIFTDSIYITVGTSSTETTDTSDSTCAVGTYYDGHCYVFYPSTVKKTTAQSTCVGVGGYLSTITTSAENVFIRSLSSVEIWIGASDGAREGTFLWTDSSLLTFQNWASDQPNNDSGQDCVEMETTGFWNDKDCDKKRAFVCEIE